MRAEKQILTKEYVARLNASPFFIVVNYRGLNVSHLTELRKRLKKAGAPEAELAAEVAGVLQSALAMKSDQAQYTRQVKDVLTRLESALPALQAAFQAATAK